jgi:hypothetical protein
MMRNAGFAEAKTFIGMMEVLVMRQLNAQIVVKNIRMKIRFKEENKMEKKQELSPIKIEQLNRQPIIETSVQRSEDKKWLVYKTIITQIYPMSYMDKVLGSV